MTRSKKERLDTLLVEKKYFPSREKARSAVMAGLVFVGGKRIDKPGCRVDRTVELEVKGNPVPYVSRGGSKLEHAINSFNINLAGKVVLDVGASTGGFTDCALQHGARLVYAVDVGYGQLDWKLRQNPRVVVIERTNVRYLSPDRLIPKPGFCTIDVSFISLKKVIPKILELTSGNASGVALIKPQFEAGRDKVGKKGVVRSAGVHIEVIDDVATYTVKSGLEVKGLDYSPLKGPQGNIEYLMYFGKVKEGKTYSIEEVKKVVACAHKKLN